MNCRARRLVSLTIVDGTPGTQNRPTSITLKNSSNATISSESYTYDDGGNLSDKTVNSVTTTYGYDDIDQLTSESRSGYSASYTYDANGNRATKTLGGTTQTYNYDDADKLTSITQGGNTVKSFGYDSAGRTTSVTANSQTTTIAYDYEGRIIQITYPNESTNTFTYNGLDTRVGKVDSTGTKTFLRDGAYVTDPVINDGTSYTPGVSERRSSTTKFYHTDRLGSTERITNTSQTTTDTREYDAFGLQINSSGSTPTPFGFAGGWGYQEDPDSGLKLLGHRYYDPSTGRFLTRDRVKSGKNWYTYAGSNPSVYVDQDGLEFVLYRLLDASGNLVKWGISKCHEKRYYPKKMRELGAEKLEVITTYGDDGKYARADEYVMVREDPGPKNLEPWAGKGIKAIPMLLLSILLLDPIGMGHGLGDAIDPPVQDAARGYKAWQSIRAGFSNPHELDDPLETGMA